MACWTVVIFSASSSGISVSNSSSRAITSSTVSSESAPRSSTKEDSVLISASFTPSCSAMIFFTRCSTFSIGAPSLRFRGYGDLGGGVFYDIYMPPLTCRTAPVT
ncbi:hypothetical protein D3C83_42550 [compost metagenome]